MAGIDRGDFSKPSRYAMQDPSMQLSEQLMKMGQGLVNQANMDEKLAYERDRQAKQDARQIEIDRQNKQLFDLKMNQAAKTEAKEQATNDALMALIYPDKYKSNKLVTEQEAIRQSINALPVNEQEAARAVVAKEYNPTESGNEWARLATINPLADASKVLNTQNSLMQAKLNDPTSAEYKAKEKADFANWKVKQDLLASINDANNQKQTDREMTTWKEKEQFKLDTEADKEKKALDQTQRLTDILIGTDLYKTPEKGRDVATIDEEIAKLQGQLRDFKDPKVQKRVSGEITKLARERIASKKKEETPKTDEELRKEILTKIKEQGVPLTPTVQSTIAARIKNLQSDPKATQEAAKVASYKKALSDLGIDAAGINNSDVLAKMYEAKTNRDSSSSKGKTRFGVGPQAIKTMSDIGIDEWFGNNQKDITEVASKYRITDKEVADIIEAYNSKGIAPRLSGSITNDVIKYIKENYKLKN